VVNLGMFENYIISEIGSMFSFSFSDSVRIIALMKTSQLLDKNITTESEAQDFINIDVKKFLLIKGFVRFKSYSLEELNKLGISLEFVRKKNDDWGTKIYFDSKNNLFWEDAPGRYSNEGYQLFLDDLIAEVIR